jgi:hypothetical protein
MSRYLIVLLTLLITVLYPIEGINNLIHVCDLFRITGPPTGRAMSFLSAVFAASLPQDY